MKKLCDCGACPRCLHRNHVNTYRASHPELWAATIKRANEKWRRKHGVPARGTKPHHSITHGHVVGGKSSPTHSSWKSMKYRCLNPKSSHYPDYGGRGILPCEHMMTFEGFLAVMGLRPEGKTLERIDNDLGYLCPACRPLTGNVVWATRKEQANNRRPRSTIPIRVNGRFANAG